MRDEQEEGDFSMKYKLWVIALIGCIAVSCAGVKKARTNAPPQAETPSQAALTLDEAVEIAAADISAKLTKGTKIAVVNFTSEAPQVSNYLMEELNFALVGRGLVVADRAQLDSARKELRFQASGEVDQKTAQSIGKFLGVEYEVTGQFIFTGETYRFRVVTVLAESAERVIVSNLTVRNDSRTIKLIETLKKTKLESHSAAY